MVSKARQSIDKILRIVTPARLYTLTDQGVTLTTNGTDVADSAPVLDLEDNTPTLLGKGLTLVIRDIPVI